MKYTMRLNGRLMTDVNVKISLTHEQVYWLEKEAKNRKLTLAQIIVIQCVNTECIETEFEEEE